MKWDESADPDDLEEDDRVAFEGLRKVHGPHALITSYER